METTSLSTNLQQHPRIGQWLRFENSKAVIFPGKVEIGQGIVTALVQIATEELGVRSDQIKANPASTASSPNETVTSGSLSIQECGFAIRHVCALAHSALFSFAKTHFAALLENDIGHPYIENGQLCLSNGRVISSYWNATFAKHLSEQTCLAFPEHPNASSVTTKNFARLDLPAKFRGEAAFIQDMRLPELRFSLMFRGADQSKQVRAIRKALASIFSVDLKTASPNALPSLLVDGEFVALTCSSLTELARFQKIAEQAITQTSLLTKSASEIETTDNDWLTTAPSERSVVFDSGLDLSQKSDETIKTTKDSGTVFEASFDKPWLSHASIGLSCALALYHPGESMQIWTHSQGIFNLRCDLFLALGEQSSLSETQFIVQHIEGAGCYGHNGADDVAFDAARIALSCPGIPIRVQWTRAQELGCAPFSPAMRVNVKAKLSNAGTNSESCDVIQWQQTIWSNGHSLRPGRAASPTLLGSSELALGTTPRVSVNAAAAMGYGSERNALPLYTFKTVLIENFRLTEMPIRSSAFRGLGAIANVFAIESMMDKIAKHLNEDPLEFRLRHLQGDAHQRARAVLNKVAQISNWKLHQAQRDALANDAIGFGLAFARYKNTGAWCAVVAKVELQENVKVKQLWIAADVGRIVNDDGVRNQLEGAAIQSTSIALLETAQYASNAQISPSWDDYPILKFSEVPEIDIELIDHPNQPSLGAGEPATAPVIAAIANAVASVIGTSIYTLPLTPETIAKAIALS
jgi:CO/xanthine dehydrogenase Mo-binding subunit